MVLLLALGLRPWRYWIRREHRGPKRTITENLVQVFWTEKWFTYQDMPKPARENVHYEGNSIRWTHVVPDVLTIRIIGSHD